MTAVLCTVCGAQVYFMVFGETIFNKSLTSISMGTYYTHFFGTLQSEVYPEGRKHPEISIRFFYRYTDAVLSIVLHLMNNVKNLPMNARSRRSMKPTSKLHWLNNFPFFNCNIPSASAYAIFISKLIGYARACSNMMLLS